MAMVDAQPSTFHQGGWQLTRKLTIIASTPALLGDSAVAQSDYPERPVTVVVPRAAGRLKFVALSPLPSLAGSWLALAGQVRCNSQPGMRVDP
jgi:hypothetical protein